MIRSDELFLKEQAGTEKFDYFVTGISGTLCAYISQTFRPEKLAFSSSTLELIALLIICISVYFGFKRIEFVLTHIQYNRRLLLLEEEKEKLVLANPKATLMHSMSQKVYSPEQTVKKIEELSSQIKFSGKNASEVAIISGKWYRRRNLSLGIGFMLLVISRVLSAYI